jgi:hypothetical protein
MQPCTCRPNPTVRTSVLSLQRELLCIRGTYCYESVLSLDAALDELRARMESDLVDPLAVRCWIVDDATLELAITVPMFSDHTYAARWCELLSSTACWSDHAIEAVQL